MQAAKRAILDTSMENLPPTVGSPAELRTFSTRPLALAIGVFDGVHRGHRKLLAEVVRLAAETDALPVALTFDPHPRAVLHPAAPPVLLVGVTERVRLLREAGMASCVVCPFTPDLARTAPEDFLDNLLDGARIAAIGVGKLWRFGAGGRGDAALLQRCAERRHWRLSAVPELELDGETVSASRIRRLVEEDRSIRYLVPDSVREAILADGGETRIDEIMETLRYLKHF